MGAGVSGHGARPADLHKVRTCLINAGAPCPCSSRVEGSASGGTKVTVRTRCILRTRLHGSRCAWWRNIPRSVLLNAYALLSCSLWERRNAMRIQSSKAVRGGENG